MSIEAALEARGLGEYKSVLLGAGLTSLSDLKDVTDSELIKLGIDKLFHRKRILQLAAEQQSASPNPAPTTVPQPASPPQGSSSNGQECGDHIRVEVLAARGAEVPLTERDYYVKVSLCDRINHEIYPLETTTQRTAKARGPTPLWSPGEKSALRIKTSFRTHCLAFELKEYRLLGENKHIGLLIFPMVKFHTFTKGYVEETWFPLRVDCEPNSEVTSMLRLRLSVPGGCPKQNGPAYHVTSVQMNSRKLKVTVFEAVIDSADEPGSPGSSTLAPSTYVTVNLDEAPTADSSKIKAKSKIVKGSWSPVFDESFEFFAEVGSCKLLTVKLKKEAGAVFTTHELIGQVRIPIQYYMAQRRPAEVDETFPAYDEDNIMRARMHVRLQVLAADATDSTPEHTASSFHRTESMRQSKPVDVDNHPAFSPRRSRSGTPTSDVEALQHQFVSDTDTDDEAANAAARRNQQAASRNFSRKPMRQMSLGDDDI